MLRAPTFITEIVNFQDPTVRFRWDEWGDDRPGQSFDETILARLKNLSLRANVAFTLATAEWIVYRLNGFTRDQLPWLYLEAAWAQQVDVNYSWEWVVPRNWTGPTRGPVRVALDRGAYALARARDYNDPSWSGATIAKLAESIVGLSTPFLAWRDRVLNRLQSLYSRNNEDSIGDVVPRNALDLTKDFSCEQTEALINRFLGGLDWQENPYLLAPNEMLKHGFEGLPYLFSFEDDRTRRNQW